MDEPAGGSCPTCGVTVDPGLVFCHACGARLGPDPIVGTTIDDRYQVVRQLGAGAMGAVYEVRHTRLGKRFAMKVIHRELSDAAEFAARFEREAHSTSRLSHPNCIAVSDFGSAPTGELYLVMEFVPGRPLSTLLGEPWPVPQALDVTRQILLGLEHAHEAGVIHRDIKPENVMIDGTVERPGPVKLVDFGIAKLGQPEPGSAQLTRAGMVLGTPQYMAPEQAAGGELDARVDLYAAGAILWQLLTGHPTHGGADYLEILAKKVSEEAPLLNQAGAGRFAGDLEQVLARALARRPEDRFANAAAFLAALMAVEDDASAGKQAAAPPRAPAPAGAPPARAVARLATRATTPFVRWYRCEESGEAPSWRARGRALIATTAGRVVGLSAACGLAAVATALVLIIGGDDGGVAVEPGAKPPPPPAPPARSSAPPEIPAELRRRLDALASLRRRSCSRARKRLVALVAEHPRVARAQYLLGDASICARYYSAGLAAFGKAIELDPGLRTDARLRASVARLLRVRALRRRALAFLERKLGRFALAEILAATTARSADLRRQAIAAVKRLGGESHIDWVRVYALELRRHPCDASIVEKLRQIPHRRALKVLRRARRRRKTALRFIRYGHVHRCIHDELDRAIADLSARLAEE